MAYAAPAEHTYHFVGGRGTGADGHANNGGGICWDSWDYDLSSWMGANGGPLAAVDDNSAALTNNGAGKCRITKAGTFSGVTKVGVLANLFDTTYDAGRYEVIAVNANYVDINLTYAADDTVSIRVGGAFNNLQTAADDNSTSAAAYNRIIWTNLDESGNAVIDIDTGPGVGSVGSMKYIVGYKTILGDRSVGGSEYKVSWTTYTCTSAAVNVLNLQIKNLYIANIKTVNTNVSPTASGFYLNAAASLTYTWLENCVGTGAFYGFRVATSNNTRTYYIDCVSYDNDYTGFRQAGSSSPITCVYLNCAAFGEAHVYGFEVNTGSGIFIGCVVYGSPAVGYGFILTGASGYALIENCVAYNLGFNGVYSLQGGDVIYVYNSIFALNGMGAFSSNAGLIRGDYNCIDTLAGSTGYNTLAGAAAIAGDHDIIGDPLLVDSDNANFDLQPCSPCWNKGKPNIQGIPTTIGAVRQRYPAPFGPIRSNL